MQKKTQNIIDLKKDDIVNDIFVVKFKKAVEQYKNGYRFEMRLGDATKEIMYKYWGPDDEAKVKALYESINKDDVIHVTGRMNEWNGLLEISGNEQASISVLREGEYDVKEFIRVSERDRDEMWNALIGFVDSVKNPEIKKILESFFLEPEFAEKFKECPAAMYVHHGWIQGLLDHTIDVTKVAQVAAETHPKLDRDLLIAGALLHDIGKLREFELTTSIRMTKEGVFIGHVTIGADMIQRKMDKLNTPKDLQYKLIHMILTHMGEYGSSKTHSIPEAVALHYCDQVSAQTTHMLDVIEKTETDDEFTWHKDFGQIYVGDKK
ncbi:HDIG domain-containing protein [Candidatus Woesearchaeota archaeon]|nr:HDIG domain-containing protein [Candidatus Woesearchaeota archaeon]